MNERSVGGGPHILLWLFGLFLGLDGIVLTAGGARYNLNDWGMTSSPFRCPHSR